MPDLTAARADTAGCTSDQHDASFRSAHLRVLSWRRKRTRFRELADQPCSDLDWLITSASTSSRTMYSVNRGAAQKHIAARTWVVRSEARVLGQKLPASGLGHHDWAIVVPTDPNEPCRFVDPTFTTSASPGSSRAACRARCRGRDREAVGLRRTAVEQVTKRSHRRPLLCESFPSV